MRLRAFLLAIAAAAAGPALAQPAVDSPAPDGVAVTVYRDPNRPVDQPFNLSWLNGYALVAERRTVSIPAGESVIRFEGVAGGMLPESAIVTGLPAGVVEKNQDAWLLSPASLLDASVGRRVHVRRTSRATGEVTETEAVIRSGAGGAVVLETPSGVEALRCTGLPETLVYDEVPDGLSARPTLSVRVRSAEPVRATLTLSYLAAGFDWQANYIAELTPDRKRMDLFAWLTLANGDETGFREADTQAVAGRLNREEAERRLPERPPLHLSCWPQGTTTSDLHEHQPPPPPPPPPAPTMDIVVTGSRVARANLASAAPVAIIAEQEELGDLKLYRIPEPVTVAARSQKQVALLSHQGVPVSIVYRFRAGSDGAEAARTTLLTRNRREERLGVPLPGGTIDVYERRGGRPLLVGRGRVGDHAVGQAVEIAIAESADVRSTLVARSRTDDLAAYAVTVSNAKPHPVQVEVLLGAAPGDVKADKRLGERYGSAVWRATVPANGERTLRYTVRTER